MTGVAPLRLNPHPSKTEGMRHPQIQRHSFGWRGRVGHSPDDTTATAQQIEKRGESSKREIQKPHPSHKAKPGRMGHPQNLLDCAWVVWRGVPPAKFTRRKEPTTSSNQPFKNS
jgi:hypothetical protein